MKIGYQINDGMVELPFGLPGRIYRSPLPFSPYFDPQQDLLESFLAENVKVVVMLTPWVEAYELTGFDLRKLYQEEGFRVIEAPIIDFSVPERGALHAPISQTLEAAQNGDHLVIHCHAGRGRTGLFIACMAKVVFDFNGADAIRWVRQFVPSAVENLQQVQFVEDFEFPTG